MLRIIPATPIIIPAELNSKGQKWSFWSNCLQKYIIIICALGFWYMKSLVSKSKTFQSWSTVEIPDWARPKKTAQPFQIEIGVPN